MITAIKHTNLEYKMQKNMQSLT